MAVAVKVIEHMSDTSHLVENEVKLQLSFAHTPYVVRALHYVSYTRPRTVSRGASSSSRSMSRRYAQVVAGPQLGQLGRQQSANSSELSFQSAALDQGVQDPNALRGSCSHEGSPAAGSDSHTFPFASSSPPGHGQSGASSSGKPLVQAAAQGGHLSSGRLPSQEQFASETPTLLPHRVGSRARFAPLPGSAGSASRLQRSAEVSFGGQVARQESSDLESTSSFATSVKLRKSMDSSAACKAETWIVMVSALLQYI
jgi:hypothetical protein